MCQIRSERPFKQGSLTAYADVSLGFFLLI